MKDGEVNGPAMCQNSGDRPGGEEWAGHEAVEGGRPWLWNGGHRTKIEDCTTQLNPDVTYGLQ